MLSHTTRLGAALLTAVLTVTAPTLVTIPAAQATGVNNQGVHMLERGDEGADVTALQYLLNAQGVATGVDGDFGSGTDASVRSFQSGRGLTSDGIVGPPPGRRWWSPSDRPPATTPMPCVPCSSS